MQTAAALRLRPIAVHHGRSPWSPDPVVVVALDCASAGHADALLGAIPALQARTADWCRARSLGSTPTPLEGIGAFLAAWSLEALTFVRGHLHAHGAQRDPTTGRVLAWVGFHEPQLSLAMLGLAARWLEVLARAPADDRACAAELSTLWTACRQRHPDYQAAIVMQAARRRGVPYAPAWGLPRHWRYGQGARSRVLFESTAATDGHVAVRAAASKSMTKTVLRSLGLPTPPFRLVSREAELAAAVEAIGFPCVTKPLDLSGGKGVSAGLVDLEAVRGGFAAARAASAGPVMVEAHVSGDDHRIMVVDGRVVAAIRREPASVTGDGVRTIRELVAAKNLGRDARSIARSGYLRPIALDASAQLHLAGLGLAPESVLEAGRCVRVRSNANLSSGGASIDVSAALHPDLRTLAETLARTLGISMLGVDYLTTDITRSPAEGAGRFIEINTAPGLCVMIAAGWSVERAGDLALGPLPGRIRLDLLIVREAAYAATCAALREARWLPGTGWAGAADAGLGGAALVVDAQTPWAGVHALLGQRVLERALLLASDAQVRRHGLPVDVCEVAHVAADLPPAWLRSVREAAVSVQIQHGSTPPQVLVTAALARLASA